MMNINKELMNDYNINDVKKYLLETGENYKESDIIKIRNAFLFVIKKKEEERMNRMKRKINEEVINDIINSFVKKDGDKLNEKTYSIYIAKAKRMDIWVNIQNIIDNKDNKDKINEIISDIKKRSYINARKKETKASYFSDFIFYNQLFRYEPIKSQLNQYVLNRFNQVIKETEKLKNDEIQDKVLFDKLKITYQEFIKLANDITNKDEIEIKDGENTTILKPTIDEKILINLYRQLPIRDNFGQVILTNKKMDNENVNYYNINDATFHLNNYKKSSLDVFGKRIYKLPKYLNDMIINKYKNGWKVLFGKSKLEFYKDTKLSKKISAIFEKYLNKNENIGINDIRRAYTTYFNENKSVKLQKELANRMLHSFEMARGVYKREQNKE